MTDESAKTRRIRRADFFSTYLKGRVIDIGCGKDPVLPTAEPYDSIYGHPHAGKIAEFKPVESYDCVYSSHCLEHMDNVPDTLRQWWGLVRPGGYLVLVVPDEELYEQGFWPSRFNPDHKATFRMGSTGAESPVSYDLVELISQLPQAELVSAERHTTGYIPWLKWNQGQTIRQKERLMAWLKPLKSFLKNHGLEYSLLGLCADRLCGFPVDQTLGRALAQIQIVCRKS